MSLDLDAAEPRDAYRVLSSLVIPRPIAWVLTLGEDGTPNLAPFSSFMGIFKPPALAISFGHRRDGSLKDTHRNLRARREGVVHIPEGSDLQMMHDSAAEAPPEVSEVGRLGLATRPSERVAPPRLAHARVALECRYREEHPLGPATDLVILDVLRVHVHEEIWDGALACADSARWDPVSRLGSIAGPNYAGLGERLLLPPSRLPDG
ncbi:MAG: flavin reductase family protein [Acidobacteria bacterium]|nr:flavin reductase family protein [Acidobacteriota bacterium]